MKVDGKEQNRALREKNYKALVIIHGCMDQNCYSTSLDSVHKRGIKLLTAHEPGYANTKPICFMLYEKVGEISGNQSKWKLLTNIPYERLTDDQLEWKKTKCSQK